MPDSTDVAKETADLIITDDRFATIVAGVEEGRIAYANIRKVVYLLAATGAAEIVIFLFHWPSILQCLLLQFRSSGSIW
jgi:Ca2+-transporting ATPase